MAGRRILLTPSSLPSLSLSLCPELFDFSDCEIRQVPVWVQFPILPLDLWTGKALSKLGSRIGMPLNTDKLTRTMDRVCYARVFIEVDVAKEFPTSIPVRCPKGNILTEEVYYEYIPYYCNDYKLLGHSVEGCPRNINQSKDQKRVAKAKGKAKIVEERGDTTEIRSIPIENKGSNLAQKGDTTSNSVKKTGGEPSVDKAADVAFTVVERNKQRKQIAVKQKAVLREIDSSSSGISDSDETESLEVGYYAKSNSSRYKPRKGSVGFAKAPKPMGRKTGGSHKGAGAIPPLVK